MLSYQPKSVILHIIKGAGADPQLIEAVKQFRCPDCPEEHLRQQPVKAPSLYLFNYEVIVDVFEIVDDENTRYSCLSCVCNGTTFHLVDGCRGRWSAQELQVPEQVLERLGRLGWLAKDPHLRPRIA